MSFKSLIDRTGDRADKEQKKLINHAVKSMDKKEKHFNTNSAKLIKEGKKKMG